MDKIALLFPGQGAQYVGMGREIYNEFKIAKNIFDQGNDILGFDLKEMCFNGNLQELSMTENAQPALLIASIANYKVMKKLVDMTPSFLAGHSLGEFSALVCAGVINFAEALVLVRKRGEIMAGASEGGMIAIMDMNENDIDQICKEISTNDSYVVISNNNSPDQIVLSGHKSAIIRAEERFSQIGVKAKILNVSSAFHSPLMREKADEFKELLNKINFEIPKWPIISNVYGRAIKNSNKILDELYQQFFNPVQWQKSIQYMIEQNCNVFVDVGPGKIIKNLVTKNISDGKIYAFDRKSDLEVLKNSYPVNVHKPKITFLAKAMAIAVSTKNNNWDNTAYELGVAKPYQEIQNINQKLEESGKQPDKEDIKMAVNMLKSVFKTKKTPIHEQIYRFEQLFDETELWDIIPYMDLPIVENGGIGIEN